MVCFDFNPRSREGSDSDAFNKVQDVVISIHAPVKGATLIDRPVRVGTFISIHAPVKGATNRYDEVMAVVNISIHAPVKGATLLGLPDR